MPSQYSMDPFLNTHSRDLHDDSCSDSLVMHCARQCTEQMMTGITRGIRRTSPLSWRSSSQFMVTDRCDLFQHLPISETFHRTSTILSPVHKSIEARRMVQMRWRFACYLKPGVCLRRSSLNGMAANGHYVPRMETSRHTFQNNYVNRGLIEASPDGWPPVTVITRLFEKTAAE